MAVVYKSLSRTNGHKEDGGVNVVRRNRQRVLILSSRGVTYRYGVPDLESIESILAT